MSSHRKRKMHSCDVCNKTYSNQSELEVHKWKHQGYEKRWDGPYKCPNTSCSYSDITGINRGFKCPRQLQNHIKKCCRHVNEQESDADAIDVASINCANEDNRLLVDVPSDIPITCASVVEARTHDAFENPYPVVSAESIMHGSSEHRKSRMWKASWKAKWNISRDAIDELENAIVNGDVQFTADTYVSGRTLDRSLDNIYNIGVVIFSICVQFSNYISFHRSQLLLQTGLMWEWISPVSIHFLL